METGFPEMLQKLGIGGIFIWLMVAICFFHMRYWRKRLHTKINTLWLKNYMETKSITHYIKTLERKTNMLKKLIKIELASIIFVSLSFLLELIYPSRTDIAIIYAIVLTVIIPIWCLFNIFAIMMEDMRKRVELTYNALAHN